MRWLGLFALWLPLLANPDDLERNREIIRRSAQLLKQDDANLDKFFFLRRKETKELNSDGTVKSRSVITTRREPYDGFTITRVVARDDKPLPEAEQRQQEERIKAEIAAARKRRAEERERPKPAAASNRKESDGDLMVKEFPEALDYRMVGAESRRGRDTMVFEFTPRPGYKPKNFKMKFFEKMKGKVWIDKATGEMVSAEAEIFETINIGFGMVGTMRKGTRFSLQRQEAAQGLWVTDSFQVRFAARLMLVKSYFQELDTRITELQLRPQAVSSAVKLALP
jgi:hypothetical protein